MAQSLSKILVHMVFSTKERRPFLTDKALREELHAYMGGILHHLGCQSIIVGGVEDHVHLLCALTRTRSPADQIKELKRGSSVWLKTREASMADFAWQAGYGIFSVSFSQVEVVRAYMLNQEAHHQKATFQDELRTLLRRYQIPFEERYLWD